MTSKNPKPRPNARECGDILTGPQVEACRLIAEGAKTLTQVAEALGVDRKTLWAWRRTAAFVDAVEGFAAENIDSAKRLLKAHARHAAAKIITSMNDRGATGLKAACELLNRVADTDLAGQAGDEFVVLEFEDGPASVKGRLHDE